MNTFDSMITNLSLLNLNELEALAKACQTKVENEKKARRETLRQELMVNLQQVMSAILGNGFDLTISNTDRNCYDGHEEVWFTANDHYGIEIE